MFRRLLAILSLLSLLLCAATVVLWVRSWRHPPLEEDRYSWLDNHGERLTVRSDAGRVTLFVPPAGNADAVAVVPAQFLQLEPPLFSGDLYLQRAMDARFVVSVGSKWKSPPTAREAATALRNEQTIWLATSGPRRIHVRSEEPYVGPVFSGDSPALYLANPTGALFVSGQYLSSLPVCLPPFSRADSTAALLPALEDPDRFAVAHLLLGTAHSPRTDLLRNADDDMAEHDGLQVRLRPLEPGPRLEHPAVYDPIQLPKIRDQWHRRLDVARWSSPWWPLSAASAVLPFLWLTTLVRHRTIRRRRRRSGRCIACGYDLRASAGRCPECGTEA